jgi:hypothetical protein
MPETVTIRWRFFSLVAVALLAAFLAAGCQQADLPDDGPPIVPSEQAARRFVEKVAAAGESAVESKKLSLTVTQEEVTSFLSIGSRLAEQYQEMQVDSLQDLQRLEDTQNFDGLDELPEWLKKLQEQGDLPDVRLPDFDLRVVIKEPQVYFHDNGHVVIRGYGEALGQRQPLRLVLAPHAGDGQLTLDFVEGRLGPVGVPELIVDQIGRGLANLILAGQEYVQVTQIRVAAGTLTVTGRYTR